MEHRAITVMFSYDYGPDEVQLNILYEPHPTNRDFVLAMTYQGYKKAWASTRENLIELRDKITKLLENKDEL